MKTILAILSLLISFTATVLAQPLTVKVSPLKTIGQKTLVELTMTNSGTNRIEAARAVCFLLDQNGHMVGQSAKWVIGQNKTTLEPNGHSQFNFVITAPHPLLSTNLTAKVSFNRLILEGGKPADTREIAITPSSGQVNSNSAKPALNK